MLKQLLRSTLLLGLIGLNANSIAEEVAEEIFVEVEDGVPSFSDRNTTESEKVDVQPSSVFEGENLVPKFKQVEEEPKQKAISYTLAITNPPDDAAIRENSGALTLTVNVSPAPGVDHQAELLMDGQVIRTLQGSGDVALNNVDRGTHQFQIRVVNKAGTEIASSPVTRVSMLRYFARPGG